MSKRKIKEYDNQENLDKVLGEDLLCPICGRTFLAGSEWAYKRFNSKKKRYIRLCSYKCACAFDRECMSPRERQKINTEARNSEICSLRDEGISIEALSVRFGLTVKTISGIITKYKI